MWSLLSFKPQLIPTLATLLVLPVLLWLGFWQLDRAEQKQTLQQSFEQKSRLAPVAITDLDFSAFDSVRYRLVTADGYYDAEKQILLDNQIRNAQPGYHVYTPLKIDGLSGVILVNRGWVPLGVSRELLPNITIDQTVVSITGRISQPANPGLLLEAIGIDQASPPYVVQHIDYEKLSRLLDYSLIPIVILLDPDLDGGYERIWKPTFGGFGPQRHMGYAVQWFALAITLLIIYFVMSVKWQRQI